MTEPAACNRKIAVRHKLVAGFGLCLEFVRVSRPIAALAAVLVVHSAMAQGASARPRGRVLLVGVYDSRAGTPIEGADVSDLGAGNSALTLAGGVVAFVRTDTNATFINVRKLGYRSEMLVVKGDSRDTVPVTVVMEPTQTLPAVVTKAHAAMRGPADTVRQLELNGFYDRRIFSGAPSSSFLTSEKIEQLTLVSDAARLTGRPFCDANLYLNGVRVIDITAIASQRPQRGLKSAPVDQLVSPSEVLAIEFYRVGDMPVEYNSTKPAGSPHCGATLIWTK